jgi:hypothetical protein
MYHAAPPLFLIVSGNTSFSVKALLRRSSSRGAAYRDQACDCGISLTGFRYASLLNRRSLTEKLVLARGKDIISD